MERVCISKKKKTKTKIEIFSKFPFLYLVLSSHHDNFKSFSFIYYIVAALSISTLLFFL